MSVTNGAYGGRDTLPRRREGFVPLVGQPRAAFSRGGTYFVLAKSTRDEAQLAHPAHTGKESPVLYTSYFIRSIQQTNVIA